MYGKVLKSEYPRGAVTLRPPRGLELVYLLLRLCGKWAHPWLAVGGPLGLLREACGTLYGSAAQASHEWVIADGAGRMVGMVMIDMISENRGRLSYAVFSEHQGKGYAFLAAACAVRYGYADLGLDEIWTRVLRENVGSNKVLARLGIVIDPSKETCYVEQGQTYTQDYGVIPSSADTP